VVDKKSQFGPGEDAQPRRRRAGGGSRSGAVTGDQAVYGMAVASELTGVNPPMLRAYEAKGLIAPHRTAGGTRRYSADDIAEVNRISDLLDEGLNLAGVEAVLDLEEQNRALRAENDRLRQGPQTRDQDGDPDGD
jgi:DNA-binding transcriptional MerR regulator